jgi:hypothetical protein
MTRNPGFDPARETTMNAEQDRIEDEGTETVTIEEPIKEPDIVRKHMRDMGRGYPEFDYKAAWEELRPEWGRLDVHYRVLFENVQRLAVDVHQDKHLDMPWPRGTNLKEQFAAMPAEALKQAATVIYNLGHWCHGGVPPEDRKLFSGSPQHGAYWKFEKYADQSIREREGKPWAGREPRPPSDLEVLCKELGVEATATKRVLTQEDEKDEWKRKAFAWNATLKYQGREMTVPFFCGEAHVQKSNRFYKGAFEQGGEWVAPKPPTAADVLSCLLSDASSYDNAVDFNEWAQDLGADEDSISAKKTYDTIGEQSKKLKRLLGEDYDRLAAAEH